jgi:phage major head subunit gpT-like protein
MAITRSQYLEALDPGIRAWYGVAYKKYKDMYPEIFEVRKSKKSAESSVSLMGTGLFTEKGEGSDISFDITKELYKSTHTHVTYSKGLRFTRELQEDNLYNIMKTMTKSLAFSRAQTVDIVDTNILNNAFDTTNYANGSDGKALITTDHPLGGGGTFANEPTNAVDLSAPALEAARTAIWGFQNDRGLIIGAMGKQLVVPPALEADAKRILESAKDPDSANNAINPSQGSLKLVVNPFLTDTDAWFILTDVEDSLVHYWRRMPDFQRDHDTNSQDLLYLATMRFSVGWDDWRGIYGSPGA